MNYRSDNPHTNWPETTAVVYRSEAFAEDLVEPRQPTAGWSLLERLLAALPLICVFAPVADAYLVH
jgi:hypothetical protein